MEQSQLLILIVKLRPLREWRAEELAKQQIQDGLISW